MTTIASSLRGAHTVSLTEMVEMAGMLAVAVLTAATIAVMF